MDTQNPMPSSEAQCTTCQAHVAEQAENEETSYAFLLALMPVLALTFMGQVGLL